MFMKQSRKSVDLTLELEIQEAFARCQSDLGGNAKTIRIRRMHNTCDWTSES